jgi:hypothetical protein
MTADARQLLDDLRANDVRLTVEFDQLRISGPSDVLDAILYQRLTFHKAELIDALTDVPPPPRLTLPPTPQVEPESVSARCGPAVVELRRDGNRWLMYVNGSRRRDFATLYLAHAQRTAEFWYGAPTGGWKEVV